MADSPSHGALFDNFSRQASHAHGGSYFDTGFGAAAMNEAHGRLYDLFGAPRPTGDKHGQRFDEFGWESMPTLHGQHFDSDFQAPQTGGEHGSTWFDVFRGGSTQARVMVGGKDIEGTVITVTRDHAIVRDHAGQEHEVGLSQFLAYRTPNEQQAGPGMPSSAAEAPSAHDETARGGGERSPQSTDIPSAVAQAPQGGPGDSRNTQIPAGLMDTFTHLKSLADQLDVEKSVDTTETAAQGGGSTAKTVSHRSNCPRGGSAPCGADVDGSCSSCGAKVRDHEAVGKAAQDPPAQAVPQRDHKTSDHHMTLGSKPGRCPHCGEVIAELDEKTEQGQPSRQQKQGQSDTFSTVTAHKCAAGGLDVLKSTFA